MLKNIVLNLIKVIIILAILIFAFKIAPNYSKDYINIKDKINLVINNKNVTKKLKYDLFITEKNVVYMSKEDIKNYFDEYIYLDKEHNQIITTYEEKIAVMPINDNVITINSSTLEILSGVILKDNVYYLPINQMSRVYNLDINYTSESNILTLDSLSKQLIKADNSKESSVKSKATIFSMSIAKIEKGEKVNIIEKLNSGWTKIRTKNGYIGYVKNNILQNQIYVRENMETEKKEEKINLVWDYYSEYASAPKRDGTTITGVNVVSPAFFSLVSNEDGKINVNIGESGKNYIKWAKSNNYEVWPMFSNNSYKDTTSKILNSYELRTSVIDNIVKLAIQYQLDGINLDFENIKTQDKDVYSRFIIELKPKLQEFGILLSVDVTAPDGGSNWSECFDRNVIGNVADYIVFMAYDQNGISSKKAGTVAGYNWVENSLKKFIDREKIDSTKIILGVPFYTRLWTEQNEKLSSRTVDIKSVDNILPKNIKKQWNEELKQYYVEYIQDDRTYKMWIEDETSIKYKASLVQQYNLAGIASWEKDRETEEIWNIIDDEIKNKY